MKENKSGVKVMYRLCVFIVDRHCFEFCSIRYTVLSVHSAIHHGV